VSTNSHPCPWCGNNGWGKYPCGWCNANPPEPRKPMQMMITEGSVILHEERREERKKERQGA